MERFLKKNKKKILSAKFRIINEKLYKTKCKDASKIFKEKKNFKEYHKGYRQQCKEWEKSPLKEIEKWLIKNQKEIDVVADIGCGEGLLELKLKGKITFRSFDLISIAPHVKEANMKTLPLEKKSISVAVFCLSLMNKDYGKAVKEARRVLKKNGVLNIVEVESRFGKGSEPFIEEIESYGFQILKEKRIGTLFRMFLFVRKKQKKKIKKETLVPCLYKRR